MNENFEFHRDKIYCVYTETHSYTGKFVKMLKIAGEPYLCFRIMEKGWGFGKNILVQVRYMSEILEFDSMAEYEEHYQNWEEDERERKFKGDF